MTPMMPEQSYNTRRCDQRCIDSPGTRENLNMPDINFGRFPIRSLVFWGLGLVMAVGLFTFTRDFTACWRLTSLPGTAPASCTNQQATSPEGPVFVTSEETASKLSQLFPNQIGDILRVFPDPINDPRPAAI